MISIAILTKRSYESWPSWHIVYEWEDELSKALRIPVLSSKTEDYYSESRFIRLFSSRQPVKAMMQWCNRASPFAKLNIVFELTVKTNFSYSNDCNAIPVIIDFYTRDVHLFNSTYKNSKLICITSLLTYNFLKENKCPLNIQYLPFSLPDKYKALEAPAKKKYDIILAGRKNRVLWDFLLVFERRFPEIEYLYQDEVEGRLVYRSNKCGIVGEFHTRDQYMNLLCQCKIAFYATPGIDGDAKRTAGFAQVTPRYLELLACGCLLLGRYEVNVETEHFEFDKYCPNIDSYEHFETLLLNYVSHGVSSDRVAYTMFLKKHYTSSLALKLKKYIEVAFPSIT